MRPEVLLRSMSVIYTLLFVTIESEVLAAGLFKPAKGIREMLRGMNTVGRRCCRRFC
jgi:hypothetical protein